MTPRTELPWVKRCVNITQEWWDELSDQLKKHLFYGIKSGDIWLNKVNITTGNASEETYVWKYTCHHEEPVCFNMLILEPVTSETSHVLSLMVCRNCAHSIVLQVLEKLESTSDMKPIDKSDLECLDLPTYCDVTVSATNSLVEHLNNTTERCR